MSKRKKSKKHSKAKPNVIVVVLTSDTEFDESMDSIKKQKKVGFEIDDIQQKTIPVVRARNHPVQI
jgi:superfamily II RNA helicase